MQRRKSFAAVRIAWLMAHCFNFALQTDGWQHWLLSIDDFWTLCFFALFPWILFIAWVLFFGNGYCFRCVKGSVLCSVFRFVLEITRPHVTVKLRRLWHALRPERVSRSCSTFNPFKGGGGQSLHIVQIVLYVWPVLFSTFYIVWSRILSAFLGISARKKLAGSRERGKKPPWQVVRLLLAKFEIEHFITHWQSIAVSGARSFLFMRLPVRLDGEEARLQTNLGRFCGACYSMYGVFLHA